MRGGCSRSGAEVLLLGRSRATDTHLLDPHVSRVHCQVLPEERPIRAGRFRQRRRHLRQRQAGQPARAEVGRPRPHRHDAHAVRRGAGGAGRARRGSRAGGGKAPAGTPPRRKTTLKGQQSGAWAEALAGPDFLALQGGPAAARSHTGYIFHATDTRRNLPLALKILDPRYVKDEKLVKRFVDAMKTVLPLRHANLIRVYSAGRQTAIICGWRWSTSRPARASPR